MGTSRFVWNQLALFGTTALLLAATGCGEFFSKKNAPMKSSNLASFLGQACASSTQGRQRFMSEINGILVTSCSKCHDSKAFRIQGGAAENNYMYALSRGPEQIAMYGSGGAGHPGGIVLSQTQVDSIQAWGELEKEDRAKCAHGANSGEVQGCTVSGRTIEVPPPSTAASTNLARSTGIVFRLRFRTLFPTPVPQVNTLTSTTDKTVWGLYESMGIYRALGGEQRFNTAVAQVAMQSLVEPQCLSAFNPAYDSTITDGTKNPGAILAPALLPGESAPTDPDLKTALYMVRNIWLYPYDKASPEVTRVKTLLSTVRAANSQLSTAGAERAARVAACNALIGSPQFWLGNPGELDVVRRVWLNLLGQVPTWDKFSGYQNASNKASYLDGEIKAQQASAGYVQNVQNWNEASLGLRPFVNLGFYTVYSNPGGAAPSAVAGVPFVSGKINAPGKAMDKNFVLIPYAGYEKWGNYRDSETCDQNLIQDFDPRTEKLVWEIRSSPTAPWAEVGSWVRKSDGTYEKKEGTIILANGKKSTLADLNQGIFDPPDMSGPPRWQVAGSTPYKYVVGGLVGTPYEHFKAGDRRIRRFAPGGVEQNGYSQVKFPISGQTGYACNTLSRFLLTCVHRPGSVSGINTFTANNWGPFDLTGVRVNSPVYWTGEGAGLLKADGSIARFNQSIWNTHDGVIIDSFANPNILSDFHCGVAVGSEVAKQDTPAFSENSAFPLGFSTYDTNEIPGKGANPPLQTAMINQAINGVGADGYTAFNQGDQEYLANQQIAQEVATEPQRLISGVLGIGPSAAVTALAHDYRKILTAPFTIGSGYLRRFYGMQGYIFPFSTDVTAPLPDNPANQTLIDSSAYVNAPWGWFYNPISNGRNSIEGFFNANGPSGWVKSHGTTGSRPMSGILTQAAFLSPVAGGTARSIAARILLRTLCAQPSDIALTDAMKADHADFIPPSQKKTHVKESCLGCHINLDPLAAALDPNFMNDPTGRSRPLPRETWGFNRGWIGDRGMANPGHGAVLGSRVTGVAEVAEKIANSPEFARCTVQNAFQAFFGRGVGSARDCAASPNADCALVDSLAERFRGTLKYNYNDMIREMATSDLSRRKN